MLYSNCIEGYYAYLNNHIYKYFGDKKLCTITKLECDNFITSLKNTHCRSVIRGKDSLKKRELTKRLSNGTINHMSFAEQKGYVVKQIFIDEGLSAKNLNRPEVQKLIKYCNNKQNNINAIIVWRLDRLSRFCVDYHGTIRPLLNKNIITA